MLLLPTERYAILVVDSNAVPAGLIAFQMFQPIPRWNRQILQARRDIDRLELSLGAPPELTRDSSRFSCVPFTEEVSGRLMSDSMFVVLVFFF
jgi:hypothetical protein